MLEANEVTVPREIAGKIKIDRIRSQQITETCVIPPINAWLERKRGKWDEQVTRMDAKDKLKFQEKIYLSEEDL